MSAELIECLQNPKLYNHEVEDFQVIETHVSWVILAGEYAYKLKKSVNFGFLNFLQLADRKYFCEQELRLNKRLAENLYLEVLPITGSVSDPKIGGEGVAIEYALKMRRFPQDQLLSQLQTRNALTSDHIDQLAHQIATFHQMTPTVSNELSFGSPEVVMEPIQQNFEQIRAMLPENKEGMIQLAALEAWAQSNYERLKPLLAERKEKGFIRECHGDIHLNNAALWNNEVVIFDCIEFNESFRMTDVTCDIAFLVMDLEDRKLYHLANRLLNRYLEETGDYQSLALMNFYKAYRAMVRAKVALFSLGHVTESHLKEAILRQYYNYANLAESYTLVPKRCLLITTGVSGTGKSYVASKVVEQFGAIRLRTDVERRRLFAKDIPTEQLYAPESIAKVYEHLYSLAQAILEAGYIVVLDAAYLKQHERLKAKEVAEMTGVPFLVIECEAPLAVIEKNITTRMEKGGDFSDATIEVVKKQLEMKEPLTASERANAYLVDTQHQENIDKLVSYIDRYLH